MSAQSFVLELGRALHALSSPAYRVEDAMDACGRRLGVRGSYYVTPTAILAAIGPAGGRQETVFLRVQPGEHDLGRMAALYAVRDAVVNGAIDAGEGLARLQSVLAAPPTQPWRLRVPAWSLAAAAAAVLLGGGAAECTAAAAIGLLVATFAGVAARRPRIGRVYEASASLGAAVLVRAAAHFVGLDQGITVLASILPLLPGLTFTTALAELTMRHLAAGSARLLGAFTELLTMVVGVALGAHIGALCFGLAANALPRPLPDAAFAPALVGIALGFAVLLGAAWSQCGWVLAAVFAGFAGNKLGSLLFDRELGACVGALAIAFAGSFYAHWRRQPATVVRTPGLLLLVPGALGYHGLDRALTGDYAAGGEFIVRMLAVGGAIVAGLLAAGALWPPPLDVEPDSVGDAG